MNTITTDDLRRMDGREGLILQGCGGDVQEWVDGINDLLTEEGILLNGSKFEDVSVFRHGELTNLLFSMEGVDLNPGKLAMWRLQTHDQFGGMWLSDYVPHALGVFVQEEMRERITGGECHDYYAALNVIGEYVNITGPAEQETEMGGMTLG